jgi:cytoskeletal protein CcmA (bactofilin family)
MRSVQLSFAAAVFACLCVPSWAQSEALENGGDTFIAAPQLNQTIDTSGDTFLTARTARISGDTQGDLHVSGYDVTVSADTDGDLYAVGATVVLQGTVAQDITAAGLSIRTERSAQASGNVRLLGNSILVDGPVTGALSVVGRDVIVNAVILGDVQILAQTLSFGPDAVIEGTLTYRTEDQMLVPDRVAPAERVAFEDVSGDMIWDDFEDFRHEFPVFPTIASRLKGFVISLLFFMVLGLLVLGVMPRRLEHLRQSIARAPGTSFLLGVVGLSILFGMVPILALTIVGLLFTPVVLLAIVVAWIFGYALGAYSVAMRVWTGFSSAGDPSNMTRILVFAATICVVALLNFIPFVGWVTNYTLVLLGIGAMTRALFLYFIGNPGLALDVDMNRSKTNHQIGE